MENRYRSFEQPEANKEKSRIDLAVEKAKEVLSVDAIDPEQFRDLYHAGVDLDAEYVKRRKASFVENGESYRRKLAYVLEGIIHEQIDLNCWFTPTTNTFKATEYDDIVNGIDEIVELTDPQSPAYVGLAIDATISNNADDKFERTKKEIDKGQLPKIKYFVSKFSRGEQFSIPRVVIEVNEITVKQMMNLWLDGKNKVLSEHPVQIQILNQIMVQLKRCFNYALRNEQIEIAEAYQRLIRIFEPIVASKQALKRKLEMNAVTLDDGSTFNIEQSLNRVFGPDAVL